MHVAMKRAYEAPSPADGRRVLVDRLWPRGLRKDEAGIDLWLKEVAPSNELRHWFAHEVEKWPEFRTRYKTELNHNPAWQELKTLAHQGDLTLVYAAHDQEHNQALILKEMLERSDS